MSDSCYQYQAYCDICREGSEWDPFLKTAEAWRDHHFGDEHPDNPMKKENCRIRRRNADEADAEVGDE